MLDVLTSPSELVTAFDERFEKWLAPRRSSTLDRVMYGVSSAADHGLVWLAFGAARTARSGDLRWGGRYLGALVGESAVTNTVKLAFRRVRPQEHFGDDEPLPYQMRRPITSSFPSGHAVTAFTAAGVLSRGSRLAPAYYALAATIAASRVYTRIHHASDGIAGVALGLALGRVARRLVR
jgi:membrane-associated phospholipid phosphatase